jgi:methyltransferase family protein
MKQFLTSSRIGKRALVVAERLLFGGRGTELFLIKLLQLHYKSRFRRDWAWREEAPHFSGYRIGFFDFVYGDAGAGPDPYFHGFFVAEILRKGDKLLDIGCGDGFFTKRFFSKSCSHIDAIDIEKDAIGTAVRENASRNIQYTVLDAVCDPFPSNRYDVIVWDGAIGHFAADTTNVMLNKITDALSEDGLFVGSESLGKEGHDHLQFFESMSDIDQLFRKHFAYRSYRILEYNLAFNPGFVRREICWRCASNPQRLDGSGWTTFRD